MGTLANLLHELDHPGGKNFKEVLPSEETDSLFRTVIVRYDTGRSVLYPLNRGQYEWYVRVAEERQLNPRTNGRKV